MKVKEESEKVGLKLNIQKPKIMASGPTTSLQIDGETMETVIYFIFLGSKISADGDSSLEIKRCFLLGRKIYDQPRQHIRKQRHCLANKGLSGQSYYFSSGHVFSSRECLLISWLRSPFAVISEPKKRKFVTIFHCFPIYLP